MSLRRLALALAVSMTVLLGVAVPRAWAWWTSTATVTTTATAYAVPAPTLSCGALGVLSVTFNWTAVSGATSYTLTAGGTTYASQTTTTRTITTAVANGTATVVAHRDFGSVTWTSAASNSRTYVVAAVSVCT